MKSIISLVIVLSMVFTFAACANDEKELKAPVNFYYINEEFSYGVEDGVVSSEARESVHLQNDMLALLKLYLEGPESPQLKRAVPAGTTIEDILIENTTMTLTLSKEFAKLNGIDLTLACSCLAKTMIECTGSNKIIIKVKNTLLGDSERIVITQQDLLLLDSNIVPEENQ